MLPQTETLCVIRYLEEGRQTATTNGQDSEDAKREEQEGELPGNYCAQPRNTGTTAPLPVNNRSTGLTAPLPPKYRSTFCNRAEQDRYQPGYSPSASQPGTIGPPSVTTSPPFSELL